MQVLQIMHSTVEMDATPNAEFFSWHISARLIFIPYVVLDKTSGQARYPFCKLGGAFH